MAEEKLADAENNNVDVEETGCLQSARDGQQLNPQPSNDPADPLNWPLAVKVQYRRRMFEAWVKHLLILPIGRGTRPSMSACRSRVIEHGYYQPSICAHGAGV